MHYGVYEGAAAGAQPTRILVLGESHHGEEGQGKPGKYPTRKVVEDYLGQRGATEARLLFFRKIALSFGIDAGKDEEKKRFWDKVFFGNYVDVVCGVGDGIAKKQVEINREKYNQDLAEFVNEHQIGAVFCFSVLAYWALPVSGGRRTGILLDGQGARLSQKAVGRKNNKSVYLRGHICEPSGLFDHPVMIYGIPHPSAQGGFDPNHFAEHLKPVFEHCCGAEEARRGLPAGPGI